MKEREEFHGATKITLSNKSKKEIFIIRVNTAPDSWKYVMIVVNMLGGVAHAWAIFFSSGLDFVLSKAVGLEYKPRDKQLCTFL